jgi:preprotein translocase subunit SecF
MERIQQRIYLSRKSLNSIEFEHEVLRIPLSVGEETSFELVIINHGEPTHVHFSLGEEIKDKVMIVQDKVYVIEKEKIAAIVKLPKSYAGAVAELGAGKIFISTGYGATKKSFSVEIVEEEEKRGKKGEGIEGREEKWEMVEREVAVSPERMALLQRLAVSTLAIALLLTFIFVVVFFSVHSFVFGLVAAMIFIFIVVYNL